MTLYCTLLLKILYLDHHCSLIHRVPHSIQWQHPVPLEGSNIIYLSRSLLIGIQLFQSFSVIKNAAIIISIFTPFCTCLSITVGEIPREESLGLRKVMCICNFANYCYIALQSLHHFFFSCHHWLSGFVSPHLHQHSM